MPALHLLCGPTGAGKTTFGKKLEQVIPAVRFSPDEWMVNLYGHNPPAQDFQDAYDRVVDLIWRITFRLLHLGLDVILDFGFWSRASRDDARARATAAGVPCTLYLLDCAEDVMRRRVLNRTEELPEDALWIDEAAFDLFKGRFEPLGEDEEHIMITTDA